MPGGARAACPAALPSRPLLASNPTRVFDWWRFVGSLATSATSPCLLAWRRRSPEGRRTFTIIDQRPSIIDQRSTLHAIHSRRLGNLRCRANLGNFIEPAADKVLWQKPPG